jgi:hypothetical protein
MILTPEVGDSKKSKNFDENEKIKFLYDILNYFNKRNYYSVEQVGRVYSYIQKYPNFEKIKKDVDDYNTKLHFNQNYNDEDFKYCLDAFNESKIQTRK